jgi:hypothetical protein
MPRPGGLTADSSLFTEALARGFYASASQGVERDAIHATRAGILGSLGIRPLSVFDTVLGSAIPTDKMGGSRPAEAMRPLVVAPPVRYACDDG